MTRRDKARAHHAGRGKETNATLLRQALLRLLPYKLRGQGELGFPAVPALLDHYLENCRALFACFGRKITDAELEGVGKLLLPALEEGFRSSSRAEVLIQFETLVPPGNSLRYTVKLLPQSPADLYRTWTDTRTTALFGAQPDAMVMDTARSLGAAENVAVLDVGAGSGRNAIALAREGFKVDAVEPVPALASALRAEALKQRLEVRVCEGMFEDHALELPAQHYQLVFMSEVVSTHVRDLGSLSAILERASGLLRGRGLLLFDLFVCIDGYKPDTLARQMSNICWCPIFTPSELEQTLRGLPLERVSQEPVLEYERRNSPDAASGRAEWFEGWANGLDLFDLPPGRAPIEQRWLLFRKRG